MNVDPGRIEAPRSAEGLRAFTQRTIDSRPNSAPRQAGVENDLHDYQRKDCPPPAEVSRIPGLPQGHPDWDRGQRPTLLQARHASLNSHHGVLDLGLDCQELTLVEPQRIIAPAIAVPAGLVQPLLVLAE